jgi:transposase
MATLISPDQFSVFVGVDVAADTVAVSLRGVSAPPSDAFTFPQTPAGYERLITHLRATGAEPARVRVVLEATGVYSIALASALARASFAIAVINPSQAHGFAKALLKRRKTDALDAQVLA